MPNSSSLCKRSHDCGDRALAASREARCAGRAKVYTWRFRLGTSTFDLRPQNNVGQPLPSRPHRDNQQSTSFASAWALLSSFEWSSCWILIQILEIWNNHWRTSHLLVLSCARRRFTWTRLRDGRLPCTNTLAPSCLRPEHLSLFILCCIMYFSSL
jgi:hypothetical protein